MTLGQGQPLDLTDIAPHAFELARVCASIASDIALVVDDSGVIRNVSIRGEGLPFSAHDWIGRRWSDTVTDETRPKIAKLIEETIATGISKRREVNHPSGAGADIPIKYAAIRLGSSNTILVAGRDLSVVAAIQQKFMSEQSELERDYWQHRNRESRYRLLFQVATDAVMVVDATSLKVIEANDACTGVFDIPVVQIVGQDVATPIKKLYRPAVHELLITARASGQAAEIHVPLAQRIGQIALSATPFRGLDGIQLLVRARDADSSSMGAVQGKPLLDFVERMPDAVVVTDGSGRVLMGNRAFDVFAATNSYPSIVGVGLADALGCRQSDVDQFLHSVRGNAIASTRLCGSASGQEVGYQLAGVLLDDNDQEHLGFSVRLEQADPKPDTPSLEPLADKLSAVTLELGRKDMRGLLASVGAIMEDYFIDTALERSGFAADRAAILLNIPENRVIERLQRALRPGSRDHPRKD